MKDFIDYLIKLVQTYPAIAAGLVGVSMSLFATQFFKKMLSDTLETSQYRRIVQLIGFMSGWLFSLGAWWLFDSKTSHFEKIYLSIGCGFASPTIYLAVTGYLYHKFPWLEKTLSGRPENVDDQGTGK